MGADQAGTLAALKALRAGTTDPLIAGHNGRIVKLMGDGVLIAFASTASRALARPAGVVERKADPEWLRFDVSRPRCRLTGGNPTSRVEAPDVRT